MNDMADLVQFLHARLNEDEQTAHAATPGPWWHNPGKQWLDKEAFESYDLSKGQEFVGYGGPHPFTGAVASTGPASNMQCMKDAAHIARHDPARALAEVDAKRAIVRDMARMLAEAEHRTEVDHYEGLGAAERTLARLALPYASHTNYRDEWRPDPTLHA